MNNHHDRRTQLIADQLTPAIESALSYVDATAGVRLVSFAQLADALALPVRELMAAAWDECYSTVGPLYHSEGHRNLLNPYNTHPEE